MFTEDYEEFAPQQRKILEQFVTDTHKHIFALRNLPEVIKGALFSRYSRSSLGLRSLLLKEFIGNDEEALFSAIVNTPEAASIAVQQQTEAICKAQAFYDRILDGYGDDSIGELGGAHLAAENISMLAAKEIEDCRIGGSPLEKSTRYVYFDQKLQGKYLFYEEPVLMTSAHRDLYIDTCNYLFDTYSKLIAPITELFEKKFPKEDEQSHAAYRAALRAKVLDSLRGLLPASTLTNVGLFGNGRYFEQLLHKMHSHDLTELQEIGRTMQDQLSLIIPSFVRRADPNHRTHLGYDRYHSSLEEEMQKMASIFSLDCERHLQPGVKLIEGPRDAAIQVAAALLYSNSDKGMAELIDHCRQLDIEELEQILDSAASSRENRRHKSPRALEQVDFTFDIVAGFDIYRDLQRHRMLSQQRQRLCCDYGFWVPEELYDTPFVEDYEKAMWRAKDAYDIISVELPKEAQYVVPMSFRVRWYFKINLRALQWLCELRSTPQGHPAYRWVAQEMASLVSKAEPLFERFFKFVDYQGYGMGRIDAEERKFNKGSLS